MMADGQPAVGPAMPRRSHAERRRAQRWAMLSTERAVAEARERASRAEEETALALRDDGLIVPGYKDPDLEELRRDAPTACRHSQHLTLLIASSKQ